MSGEYYVRLPSGLVRGPFDSERDAELYLADCPYWVAEKSVVFFRWRDAE